jgi:hypothetical protein
VSSDKPQWRVAFWFLDTRQFGVSWVQLGFAYVEARDRDHAITLCSQRAAKLGFGINKDTIIRARRETGGRL